MSIRNSTIALSLLLALSPAYGQNIGGGVSNVGGNIGSSSNVTPNGATTGSALSVFMSNIRRPEDFGAICNGNTTNAATDTAAINAALVQLNSEGGGTLLIKNEICDITGSIVFPNDGLTIPHQNPIRIQGVAGYASGRTALPAGNSILYFVSGSGKAKLDTRGLGEVEIVDVTLQSGDTSGAVPFIQTTNTTLKIRNVAFVGANAGASANEDAIVLGGTTSSGTINGTATSPFQGYGTVIQNSYFSQIKRAIVAQTYANGWVARDNEVWADSGNATGGVIEITGGVISAVQQFDTGIVLEGNVLELVHYAYGVRCINGCELNSFIANNGYDNPSATAVVSIDSTSFNNLIIGGMQPGGSAPYLVDNGLNDTYLSIDANNLPSIIPYLNVIKAFIVPGSATFTGGTNKTTIQPAAASANTVIFQLLRSAAEGTNPGGTIFGFNNDGSQNWGNNAGSGNITNALSTGASWFNNAKSWGFNGTSGGNMVQNSGTGGSFFDMHNFAVRNYDQSNNLQAKFWASACGAGIGWDLGSAGDVGFYRSAAGAMTECGTFAATIVQTNGYTIGAGGSQLPTAGVAGRRAFVTDQLTACVAAGAALIGGGSVKCPVFDNGTAWVGD